MNLNNELKDLKKKEKFNFPWGLLLMLLLKSKTSRLWFLFKNINEHI